jgi:hypothetical protein
VRVRPGEVPIVIGRDEAREAARAELSDPRYAEARPSWFRQLVDWLWERLSELLSGAANVVPGGAVGLIVLVVVVLVLVVVIRLRVGGLARTRRRRSAPVFAAPPVSAEEYRAAAERAFATGNPDEAVRERFRAIVRGLEERGVLDERSGRTAHEAAAEAGALLPDPAERLRTAATLFDDVHYGGRPATAEGYRSLTDLDRALQATRPVGIT